MLRNPITLGFGIALLVLNAFVCAQFGMLRSEMTKLKSRQDEYDKALKTEVSRLNDRTVVSSRTVHKTLSSVQEQLKQQLEETRLQASRVAGQAKVEANYRTEDLAKRLNAEQRAQEQLKSELSKVRETASTAHVKIGEVDQEVTSVKNSLANDRSQLQRAVSDLKRVNGELGVQSGLIATNHRELESLRALGDRSYYEFNLNKSKEFFKLSSVRLQLRKADPKRSRCTLAVVADEKQMEKRDRTLNDPIQFYVTSLRQPYDKAVNEMYEIVIYDIKKDAVSGYLSTPKHDSAPVYAAR